MQRRERVHTRMRACRGEGPPALWLLFLYAFALPLGLPYENWASQEQFVLPEVLTPVLRPSFVLFSGAFPFLVS